MGRILQALGYGMLAIAAILLITFGGAFLAALGAVVSMAGLGLAAVVFVAYLIKDGLEHRRRSKDIRE